MWAFLQLIGTVVSLLSIFAMYNQADFSIQKLAILNIGVILFVGGVIVNAINSLKEPSEKKEKK